MMVRLQSSGRPCRPLAGRQATSASSWVHRGLRLRAPAPSTLQPACGLAVWLSPVQWQPYHAGSRRSRQSAASSQSVGSVSEADRAAPAFSRCGTIAWHRLCESCDIASVPGTEISSKLAWRAAGQVAASGADSAREKRAARLVALAVGISLAMQPTVSSGHQGWDDMPKAWLALQTFACLVLP